MTTTVMNIREAPAGWEHDPRYVYIGRECRRGKWDLDPSQWANPFVIGRDGDRDQVIVKCRSQAFESAEFLQRVRDNLTDKILLCWCKPKRCHGDIYVEICDAPYVTAADWTVVR